jgi:anaerobic magnesium-protoporphyrin IX monomethyl ester cyclase
MVEHINANVAHAVSRHAHEQGCAVVWVGAFVTALYEEEIRNECVDFILRGEWDFSVKALFDACNAKASLDRIPGLAWKSPLKTAVFNPAGVPIEDLDSLPIPAYDLLDLGKFYESVFVRFPAATMITSRGCPFNCIFCSYPQTLYGHKFRAMSPKRVLEEFTYLVKERGVREIRIDDDTFDIDRKRVIDICRAVPAATDDRRGGTLAQESRVPHGAVRRRIRERGDSEKDKEKYHQRRNSEGRRNCKEARNRCA